MAKHCLQMGDDGPPERLPRLPAEKAKLYDADTWFLDLYQSLGEPLVEVDPSFLDAEVCVPTDDADRPLWSRYLSPVCNSFDDLFLM